jgi:hypothetical protein
LARHRNCAREHPEEWLSDAAAELNCVLKVAATHEETLVEWEHYQQVNARVVEEWREHPWQAVIDESERLFDALVAQMHALDPATLVDPNRYAWQEGRSLLAGWWGVVEGGS